MAVVIGRLAADPELWYTVAGTPLAEFSLVTTGKGGGEHIRICSTGPLAEKCAEHLAKGYVVEVRGSIETRNGKRCLVADKIHGQGIGGL